MIVILIFLCLLSIFLHRICLFSFWRKFFKFFPNELHRFLFIVYNFLIVCRKKNSLHTPAIPLFFSVSFSIQITLTDLPIFSCPNFFFGPIFSSVSTSFIMYIDFILLNIYNCFFLDFCTPNIFIADNRSVFGVFHSFPFVLSGSVSPLKKTFFISNQITNKSKGKETIENNKWIWYHKTWLQIENTTNVRNFDWLYNKWIKIKINSVKSIIEGSNFISLICLLRLFFVCGLWFVVQVIFCNVIFFLFWFWNEFLSFTILEE